MSYVRGSGPAGHGSSYGSFRVSTAERDATVDVLRTAFADGRLTDTEFSARMDSALEAVTYDDLHRLTSDLPGHDRPHYRPAPTPAIAYLPANPPPEPAAVGSLVTGIAGYVSFGPLAWIPGIVMGHKAMAATRDGLHGGRSMAVAGLLLSYSGMVMTVLVVVGFIAFGLAFASGPACGP